MTAQVTERVKIPLCASAVVSFCHIREAANKLTHFLFDGALLSSTRLLNSPTRQPDADHICALYAFHITAHLQERFFPLGWVAEYFYYKPGSIYNETVCICYQLPAAKRLGGSPPPVCHVPQQTEQTLVWVVQRTSAELRSGSAQL